MLSSMSTTEPTPTCTEGCIVDNDESVFEVSTCNQNDHIKLW